ncbi:unnamed protein product [Didymodactylos carnosus]|uniref:UBC core domain-containing protein n=1 Tax=Didymodactylos carnosus TaxID=1234261 RepID=A0A8S2HS03_9BILA|nr:unnamed protein product [Didymodactylos carnosus]CAF3654076.1 unnamed protein product [Didymodactylos carnosus]
MLIGDRDIYHWKVIQGSERTPFENGFFDLDICFKQVYPFKSPKNYYIMSGHLEARTMAKILSEILSLMSNPNNDEYFRADDIELYHKIVKCLI